MKVVCTNCQQVLANVEVLIPFGAAVNCGECGVTSGLRFVTDDKPAPVLSLDEQISLVELEIESAAEKLKKLKATPRAPIAASGS